MNSLETFQINDRVVHEDKGLSGVVCGIAGISHQMIQVKYDAWWKFTSWEKAYNFYPIVDDKCE